MGVSVIAMMAVSMAMAAKAQQEQEKALAEQSKAAAIQAESEIKELDRQREFVDEEAATQKSARVREADRMEASMLVGMADMGGEGSANEARLSQEVGFYEGLDIARLEGNRTRQAESLKSQQVSAKNTAISLGIQNRFKAKASKYQFMSSAAKSGASAFSSGGAKTKAPGGQGIGSTADLSPDSRGYSDF